MARKFQKLMQINGRYRFSVINIFLVMTTIETDSGINRKLPPMEELIDPPVIKERNFYGGRKQK